MPNTAPVPTSRSQSWKPPTTNRWSINDAQAMLAAFRDSGLSLTRFTKLHGITVQRFYYWRAKIAELESSTARTSKSPVEPMVREVRIVGIQTRAEGEPQSKKESIRVQAGSLRFVVDSSSDREALRHLIQAIMAETSHAND